MTQKFLLRGKRSNLEKEERRFEEGGLGQGEVPDFQGNRAGDVPLIAGHGVETGVLAWYCGLRNEKINPDRLVCAGLEIKRYSRQRCTFERLAGGWVCERDECIRIPPRAERLVCPVPIGARLVYMHVLLAIQRKAVARNHVPARSFQ